MSNWYVGSTKYAAVPQWSASATVTVGTVRRQLATPALGSERCFVASSITTGVTGASEPSWNLTPGSTTTDGGVTWTECTGQAARNGDGGGSAWGAPHARLANALASGWAAAGDTIYVSNNHAETQASALTLTSPGTAAAPCNILCASDTAAPPAALATGASISTTGVSSITTSGYAYCYGLTINMGTTGGQFNASGNNVFCFDQCTIDLTSNNTASSMIYPGANGAANAYGQFRGCTFLFGSTGQKIQPNYGKLDFINCTFAPSGSVPTTLFSNNAAAGLCTVRDSDLSAIAGSLVSASPTCSGDILFENCKLNAAASLTTGSFSSNGGMSVRMHNCDSGSKNYRFQESNYAGSVQSETTIVRSSGASDGTTALSFNAASSANANFAAPLMLPEIAKWNDSIGSSVTATIEVTSNYTLTNGDIWIALEYPGSASNPQGAVASSRKTDVLASASNLASSAASWGGSQSTPQKLQVSFTPLQKGPVKARVYLARPSATVYVDPLLTLQ